MAAIRIIMADDHTVLRAGLRMLLDAQSDITVIGEAGSGAELLGLTAQLQADLILLDLSMPGLTVNAVCPGVIATDMWEYNDRMWGRLLGYGPGEFMQERIARIPLRRAGTVRDVAGVVAFLASDDADYITGQSINVNGGSIMS